MQPLPFTVDMSELAMFSYKQSQIGEYLPASHMHHGLHNMYARESIPESFLFKVWVFQKKFSYGTHLLVEMFYELCFHVFVSTAASKVNLKTNIFFIDKKKI